MQSGFQKRLTVCSFHKKCDIEEFLQSVGNAAQNYTASRSKKTTKLTAQSGLNLV